VATNFREVLLARFNRVCNVAHTAQDLPVGQAYDLRATVKEDVIGLLQAFNGESATRLGMPAEDVEFIGSVRTQLIEKPLDKFGELKPTPHQLRRLCNIFLAQRNRQPRPADKRAVPVVDSAPIDKITFDQYRQDAGNVLVPDGYVLQNAALRKVRVAR
jgi:hypothetical protein